MTPAMIERFVNEPRLRDFMLWYFRAKCMMDFWTFHYHFVCSLNGGRGYPHYSHRFHGPQGVAGFLQTPWRIERDGMQLPVSTSVLTMHREARKSQQAISWYLWNWVRDPDWRLMFRAHTAPKASETGGALLSVLDSPEWRVLFPWVKPRRKNANASPTKWSPSGFLLHRRDGGVKVMSFEANGLENEPTGGHFHALGYDDFEVAKTAQSDVNRRKMFEAFQNDENLLMAMGLRLLIGTPWVMDGLIDQAIKGRGMFSDQIYRLHVVRDVEKMFDKPFEGDSGRVQDDGRTIVLGVDADLPPGGLERHQAKLTFYSPLLKDTVVEIREVESNDDRSIRLSRPVPAAYGDPLRWTVSNVRPSFWEGFTLDEVDLPGEDGGIDRKSLVRSERNQGTSVYSFQMRLDPVDPASQVLNPSLLEEVNWEQIAPDTKENPRWWYRAWDLASRQKTAASTAGITGFWNHDGLFVTHIFFQNQAKQADIMLELFLGILKAESEGFTFRGHLFERAHYEQSLMENLEAAERDVYRYFSLLGGRYAEIAEQEFKDRGAMYVLPREMISRGGAASKPQRNIPAIQVPLEQRRIHILADCPHADVIREQMMLERYDTTDPLDLMDCLADLCKAPRPRKGGVVDLEAERRKRMEDRMLAGARVHRSGLALNWDV